MTWYRFHLGLTGVFLVAVAYIGWRLWGHGDSLLVSIALANDVTEYAIVDLREAMKDLRVELREVRDEHATILRWLMTTLGAIVVQLVTYLVTKRGRK